MTDPSCVHGKVQEALERQAEVRELKELYKMPTWIPVSERLPEESLGVVLIHIEPERIKQWAGDPSEASDNYRFYEDNYSTEVDMWNTIAVRHWAQQADWLTHWMPLPAPPNR